jgi:hypothetical protein
MGKTMRMSVLGASEKNRQRVKTGKWRAVIASVIEY